MGAGRAPTASTLANCFEDLKFLEVAIEAKKAANEQCYQARYRPQKR